LYFGRGERGREGGISRELGSRGILGGEEEAKGIRGSGCESERPERPRRKEFPRGSLTNRGSLRPGEEINPFEQEGIIEGE
jgi:hypothetical protein